jgi:acetoin utilization protein AcuB
MRVKNRMTRNPIVAPLKTNYNEALQIMKQNNIKHLPIVNAKGKPVGIVTRANMLQAQPSPVTTLSVFEIGSWLDNVTMENIMNSPVLAVDESCSITNAAKFMLGNQIGSLLVMREKDMVGIITATDIFKTFIGITGGDQSGSRIEVRIPNQKGSLAPFMQALSNAGSFIVSLAITDEDADYGYMDVKERGGDEEAIRKEIAKLDGVEILSFHYSESDKLLSLGKK